jgi:ligand-binding SRPBCC domain-containing protein
MTQLENSIFISAPKHLVWAALAALDELHQFDPGVKKATIISQLRQGVGAARQCQLTPGGWFKEKVTDWKPGEALAFELFDCTLPGRSLRHSYTFQASAGGTMVTQHMEYTLKFGVLGKLLDALMVRSKWDAGIKSFFAGLKQHVEAKGRASAEA